MISDLDIYRSANELIKQHGEAADIEAAMRADERLAAGDMEGEAVWLRIIRGPVGRSLIWAEKGLEMRPFDGPLIVPSAGTYKRNSRETPISSRPFRKIIQ